MKIPSRLRTQNSWLSLEKAKTDPASQLLFQHPPPPLKTYCVGQHESTDRILQQGWGRSDTQNVEGKESGDGD